MINWLILFFVAAVIDWVAVARGWKKVELVAKPLAMLVLLGMLAFTGGFGSLSLICFGVGLSLSLAGDVFLMVSFVRFSNRWFFPGLIAFLLAHVAYVVGLNVLPGGLDPLWGLGLALILALTARRVIGRIVTSIRQKGLKRLVVPVVAYGTIITMMVLSALLTLYRVEWKTPAAGLVSLGAILFYASDLLLAWNKFVVPVRFGRLANMIPYHLGQAALVAGVIIQFAK